MIAVTLINLELKYKSDACHVAVSVLADIKAGIGGGGRYYDYDK